MNLKQTDFMPSICVCQAEQNERNGKLVRIFLCHRRPVLFGRPKYAHTQKKKSYIGSGFNSFDMNMN